jgi:hypothetical protein
MTAREELLHHRTSAALLSPCRASIWRTADERFWYLEPLRRTAGGRRQRVRHAPVAGAWQAIVRRIGTAQAPASLATEKQPVARAGHPLCSRQMCVIDLPRTVAIRCSVGANQVFDRIAPITAACGSIQQEEVGREMLTVIVG